MSISEERRWRLAVKLTRHLADDCLVRVLLSAATVIAALAATPTAASTSGALQHRCSFRYGIGAYQDVSYGGQTNCAEATLLVRLGTHDGRQRPRVGARTVRLPHSTWRCVTVPRREVHGEIVSTHQVTCTLREPRGHHARVRFFYES